MRSHSVVLSLLVVVMTTASVAHAAEAAKPIGVNEPGVNRKAAPITVNEEGIGSDAAQAARSPSASETMGPKQASPVEKRDPAAAAQTHRGNKIEALTIKQKATEYRHTHSRAADSRAAADSAGPSGDDASAVKSAESPITVNEEGIGSDSAQRRAPSPGGVPQKKRE